MVDYLPLMTKLIEGMGSEDRRAAYERARSALNNQLRSFNPPLSEADIARERRSLEDTIRLVEADIVARTPVVQLPHI